MERSRSGRAGASRGEGPPCYVRVPTPAISRDRRIAGRARQLGWLNRRRSPETREAELRNIWVFAC